MVIGKNFLWVFWNNNHISELYEKGITVMVTMHTQGLTIPKTKTEDKDILDKINNKLSIINETSTILVEIKVKVKKNIKLIYESMCELQDEIYSDDSWLKLAVLNKLDAIIDDALNVTWNMIC